MLGQMTWGSCTTGVTGAVSASNSLIGSTAYDQVGNDMVVLANGNFVVSSGYWNNGTAADSGAVTWGSGTTGVTGTVSMSNSLVGSTIYDYVGNVTALPNGNYVVGTSSWSNGAATNAGAVTWGNGMTGVTGTVSAANSLIGSVANDYVGYYPSVTVLANSNYVVSSGLWSSGIGAATWGNGATGITGTISDTNSLIGSTANDGVGNNVTALSNGNYVVSSFSWHNGTAANAGAATWGNGTTGVTGTVSAANSLVGSTANDRAGYNVTATQQWQLCGE